MNKVVVLETSQDGGVPKRDAKKLCDRALNDLLFRK